MEFKFKEYVRINWELSGQFITEVNTSSIKEYLVNTPNGLVLVNSSLVAKFLPKENEFVIIDDGKKVFASSYDDNISKLRNVTIIPFINIQHFEDYVRNKSHQ